MEQRNIYSVFHYLKKLLKESDQLSIKDGEHWLQLADMAKEYLEHKSERPNMHESNSSLISIYKDLEYSILNSCLFKSEF